MTKKILFFLTIVLIMTIGCVSGCEGCSCDGEDGLRYQVGWDKGAVVEETEQEAAETDETYERGSELPTEDELGAPVYQDDLDPGSVSSSKTEEDGESKHVGADFKTKDDFWTVYEWYANQLGAPTARSQTPEGHNQASWVIEKNGRHILVSLLCTDDGTTISIINDKL
ncbi:MAG: hypothetical protein A2Y75_09680 [Candidatus Solincola sediminis]|uniref:Lipoprotein n=1 Tax=Candidatus Solincola sediminis TaxID=1797199 RepID=A0A1F2WEW3_9ACTN|nr:MAG: hypothetical protein A2Y75_09680 [Candidatus Solincola sediminis]